MMRLIQGQKSITLILELSLFWVLGDPGGAKTHQCKRTIKRFMRTNFISTKPLNRPRNL